MDFNIRENEIVDYISSKFNYHFDTIKTETIDHFLNEYLDFDLYDYNNSIFFSFEDYHYDELTNSSKLENLNMSVFIVVRNDTEKNLHEKLRIYASAFYNMFESGNYNFNGIVDIGLINQVHFYDAVEGDPNKKLCKIDLTLMTETINYMTIDT
jgi:hypothetical protein